MKPNIFEESNFYPKSFSQSRHYFLFRNVILKKKDSLGAPDKNFILKVAVGLSLENAADNLHEKTKIWAGMKNKVTEIRLRCYNHGEI